MNLSDKIKNNIIITSPKILSGIEKLELLNKELVDALKSYLRIYCNMCPEDNKHNSIECGDCRSLKDYRLIEKAEKE